MARGKLTGVHKLKAGMMLYLGEDQWRKIEKVSRRGRTFEVKIEGRPEPYHLKQESAVRVYQFKSKRALANEEQTKWLNTGLHVVLKLLVAYILVQLLIAAIVLLVALVFKDVH
ncbi:hypothetical protein ES705_12979 [subsurface metagenome]